MDLGMGFKVQGLGFGGMGVWFGVWGLGFRAYSCLEFKFKACCFRA